MHGDSPNAISHVLPLAFKGSTCNAARLRLHQDQSRVRSLRCAIGTLSEDTNDHPQTRLKDCDLHVVPGSAGEVGSGSSSVLRTLFAGCRRALHGMVQLDHHGLMVLCCSLRVFCDTFRVAVCPPDSHQRTVAHQAKSPSVENHSPTSRNLRLNARFVPVWR